MSADKPESALTTPLAGSAAPTRSPRHVPGIRSRGPQLHDPERYWIPARFVHVPQECDFCRFTIPRSSPGARTGERGTKAYFNSLLKVWECMGCRQEALRALGAQHELDNPRRAA